MQHPSGWIYSVLKRITLHRRINHDKTAGGHLGKMRACSINYELLTIIRNSHAEMISNGFVKVKTRCPAECRGQLFAYKLFS
jgi:hypothetical protein